MTTSIPKPRTTSFVSSTHSPTTITIPLGSRVVLTKRRSGWVRYIGKLKNEAGEWYGIALDEGKGDCDGSHEKERYFDCTAHHGVFVRRKEIFCVKEYPVRAKGGPSSPVAHDNSDADSSTSSSLDSHDATHLSPLPLDVPAPPAASTTSVVQQATAVITPLVRTFKSFRKELGLQISPTKLASNNNHHSSSSSGTSGTHAANSPKAAQPTASSSGATKSSGLRSPSSSRFGSFSPASSPASTTSRTASIVSQMVATPLDKPSHSSAAKTLRPSPSAHTASSASAERDEQQRQQALTQDTSCTGPSLGDLLGDSDGISSLSDLYRDAPPEAPPTEAVTPIRGIACSVSASPSVSPTSTTSTTSTSSTTSSSRTESVASLSPRTGAPPAVARVSSFSTLTAVESIKSSRHAEPTPAPLFFRRANIGSPTLSRRASFTSGGMSPSLSSSSSDKTSPTHAAATARLAELEKEISVMKTNHENIVAVLRATNKQHAVNVLELRAQVEALTEGNHWLEKQLVSKNALVAELREMESSGDRVPRAEVESIIAIKDAQIQTLEREVAKLKRQVLRIETEKDSILCQQVRHARWRHESDEARIAKLREDVLAMCNERTSLQSELQDLKEMTTFLL